MRVERIRTRKEERPLESGGPPCPESQADGVPCDELGRDCDDCERGQPRERRADNPQ